MKKKTRAKLGVKHAVVAGLLLASSVTGGYFFLEKSKMKVPSYNAKRVIDGDTFETMEKQIIRLSSLDAPELEMCWGRQSKSQLEKLIMTKPIYLKMEFIDSYDRLVSNVYTEDGSVNEAMIRGGYAYYHKTEHDSGDELLEAAAEARTKKKGIYSPECTQTENTGSPQCNIKGNIRDGVKIYYPSTCGYYNQTSVELSKGDKWFCSEEDAIREGFRKREKCT